MSESVEMYLVMTAMLRRGKQPVPLSRLAEKLAISPVSTNEMCRKLAERGLVEYQPYKGVTLTPEGNTRAQRILRRRRLWETFLHEKLFLDKQEADAIACQLEHVSSDNLTEQLAAFLAQHTPDNQLPPPIAHPDTTYPMASLTAGQRGQVVSIAADDVVRDFLRGQGILPGVVLDVLAVGSDGSMLLEMMDHCLSLSRTIAEQVDVIPSEEPTDPQPDGQPASS
jgi:DtxR family Mn-dependent transcriptional regulator